MIFDNLILICIQVSKISLNKNNPKFLILFLVWLVYCPN